MFDLTSSKLLILAVVALIVVGPKDLPVLLRTLGRYMGMIRRQANEFRAQFDEAMRETELAQLKKDVEDLGREAQQTLRDTTQTVETHLGDVNREIDNSLAAVGRTEAAPDAAALGSSGESQPPSNPTTALPDPGAVESPTPVTIQAPPAAMPREPAHASVGASDAYRGGA